MNTSGTVKARQEVTFLSGQISSSQAGEEIVIL
jgi:hypothetical protein